MAITVNDREFVTLDDAFYINGARVIEARLGDGRLVYPRDRKPYGIEIVQPPFRKNYKNGDKLSFDGIAVVLLNEDGTIFKDKRYPNGVIPFDELKFSTDTAEGAEGDIATDGYGLNCMYVTLSETMVIPNWGYVFNYSATAIGSGTGQYQGLASHFGRIAPSSGGYFLTIYDDPKTFGWEHVFVKFAEGATGGGFGVVFTNDGKSGAHGMIGFGQPSANGWRPMTNFGAGETWGNVPHSTRNPAEAGELKTIQEIVVSWDSVYEPKTFTDLFNVNVLWEG